MEYMKDVLIKEAGGVDKVFVVDNLPKELIYKKAKKLVFVPRHATDYDPHFPKVVEAYELRDENMPDEPRNRRLTHEMSDELLPGIEASQTGDGSFVFFVNLHESRARLDAIDSYIKRVVGPLVQVPERVEYTSIRGSFLAPPKAKSDLPRVVLPGLVSPPADAVASAVQDQQPAGASSTRLLSDAALKQRTENLRRGREKRKLEAQERARVEKAQRDALKGKEIAQ